MIIFQLSTNQHDQFIDITARVQEQIPQGFSGLCLVYAPHTSAAVMINEGADPNVRSDSINKLSKMVPWNDPDFDHAEGNSAAHIKAMIVGNDQMVIVENGKLQLGTWESIFFCEFDDPRSRKVWLQLVKQ